MARELNMDTRRQNFWKESIHKEAFVRLAWHGRYRDEIEEKNKRRETKSDTGRQIQMKRIATMVPKIPEKNLVLPVINYPKKNKSKRDEILQRSAPAKFDGNSSLTEMRPVSPDIRTLLYNGFTKEEKGRYQYLRARMHKRPEDKYQHPMTSSWEYGWRLNDVVTEFRAPRFGRSRVVRDTFFRRNGILYEPVAA